jgi:hypothetical protein
LGVLSVESVPLEEAAAPPPREVIVPKTEFAPLLPFVKFELNAPPAPTVTVKLVPVTIVIGDSAALPPPEFSPITDERYPPAPPPPENCIVEPPPAITRYSIKLPKAPAADKIPKGKSIS